MPRALMLTALCLGVLGCGADEASTTTYIAASVDGRPWYAEATDGMVVYGFDASPGLASVYSISSQNFGAQVQFLSINLPLPPLPGTYRLGVDSAFATYGLCQGRNGLDGCTIWRATNALPGTMTITSVDSATGMIEGSFAFTGHSAGSPPAPDKSVLGGRFRVHFAGP